MLSVVMLNVVAPFASVQSCPWLQ